MVNSIGRIGIEAELRVRRCGTLVPVLPFQQVWKHSALETRTKNLSGSATPLLTASSRDPTPLIRVYPDQMASHNRVCV